MIDLHGVGVEWSCDGLPSDPVAPLLRGLPVASGVSRLALTLRPGAGRDPAADGGAPLFFHGHMRGFLLGEEVVLWDRRSRLAVGPGGTRIRGEVHPESLDEDEEGFPTLLFIALVVALRHHSLFHAHAAGLRSADGTSVLVAGGSGSGKTTCALSLLEGGWRYLGDDAVLLSEAGVLAFPKPFHLGTPTLEAFPRLRPFCGTPNGRGKRALDPAVAFPGQHAPRAERIELLLFPEVHDAAATVIEPMAPADALGLLLASSAMLIVDHLPGVREQLAILRGLVDGARSFSLRLGRDALARPALLASLVRGC